MISALHLLWIIPLSATVGVFMTALCVAAEEGDRQLGIDK